jgi:hypothetical protein
MEQDWVKVYSTDKPYQADIVLEVLEENSVIGVVLNKKDSTYTFFGLTEVYVNKTDAEKAKEIIKTSEL